MPVLLRVPVQDGADRRIDIAVMVDRRDAAEHAWT
jgi:hypothetical protein